MIVPKYWAEATETIQLDGRRITLKRFGWSDDGPDAAETHANERLAQAIGSKRDGKDILPREPKAAYNGADGVPIREEIVAVHGDSVLTRNSYGALCLNTPDVLFADVDVESGPGLFRYATSIGLVAILLQVVAWVMDWGNMFCIVFFLAILIGPVLTSILDSIDERLRGDPAHRAMRLIERFSRRNPHWHLRVYRTPAGWRVLVMHETFEPRSDQVAQFFNAIRADWLYVRMCFNQNCFRARVSPKPWRVGLQNHLRPRPGVWPIAAHRMADRFLWINHYETLCKRFASCRYERQLGSLTTCNEARDVQRLHDELCQANSDLPIA